MTTTPSLPLRGLMRYLAAGPTQVGPVTAQLKGYGQGYSPAKDYWGPMLRGIQADRRTTRDGAAVRAAAQNVADGRKRPNYARVATAWQSITPRWAHYAAHPLPPQVLRVGGLDVRVNPVFAERAADGAVEVVMANLAMSLRLSDDVANAVLRLLDLAYPAAAPVLVDVPAARIHTHAGKRLERYDLYLEAACVFLAHALSEAA